MTHPDTATQHVGGNISLCTGSGALDLAVEAATGLPTVAVAERDPAASRLLAARMPDAVNLGDITAVDWAAVAASMPRPASLTAGFPCQDISNAGPRGGIAGGRSGLWKTVAHAIRVLRPRLVFLENVAAIRSRGLDVVAADLAAIGYDARWMCLRAGDPEIGAPTDATGGSPSPIPLLKTPTSQLGRNGGPQHPDKRRAGGHGPTLEDEVVFLLPPRDN